MLKNMTNKKTIILGIIALAFLGGVVWYSSQNKQPIDNQAASIAESVAKGDNAELLNDFALGDDKAPVTIIEYSSHLCGHCADFHSETLPLIIDKYIKEGQVKVIHRIVSPSVLSMAVLCASEQGNFWQFDEYLFEHIQEILEQVSGIDSPEEAEAMVIDWLKTTAGNLDLDKDRFNQCFDSSKYEKEIIAWFDKADEDGVKGTPTFLIDGEKVIGAQSYINFEKIIEEKLNQ